MYATRTVRSKPLHHPAQDCCLAGSYFAGDYHQTLTALDTVGLWHIGIRVVSPGVGTPRRAVLGAVGVGEAVGND